MSEINIEELAAQLNRIEATLTQMQSQLTLRNESIRENISEMAIFHIPYCLMINITNQQFFLSFM